MNQNENGSPGDEAQRAKTTKTIPNHPDQRKALNHRDEEYR
jgi:hypothetical protein